MPAIIFLAFLAAFVAPRPMVLAAEEIPLVETIHVLMLGTVSMERPPIKKAMMTMPKLRIPLPANQAIFSIVSPLESSNCW